MKIQMKVSSYLLQCHATGECSFNASANDKTKECLRIQLHLSFQSFGKDMIVKEDLKVSPHFKTARPLGYLSHFSVMLDY